MIILIIRRKVLYIIYVFIIRTLGKLGMEGNILNVIKGYI